jgi:hypothetical protein
MDGEREVIRAQGGPAGATWGVLIIVVLTLVLAGLLLARYQCHRKDGHHWFWLPAQGTWGCVDLNE